MQRKLDEFERAINRTLVLISETPLEKRCEPVWRKNIDDYNGQQVELRRKKDWDKVFSELASLTSELLRKYKGLSGIQETNDFKWLDITCI